MSQPRDIYRACPPGRTRGIDVARLYQEIQAIVRAKFTSTDLGVDVDDLVQETALAIVRKNDSEASAFDPSRASFSKYVYMVARGKLSHMREAAHLDRLEFHDDDTVFDAVTRLVDGDARAGNLEPTTIANVVELLQEAADLARERGGDRYFEGFCDAARSTAELLSAAFVGEATAPTKKKTPTAAEAKAARQAVLRKRRRELADRVLALMQFARRPVWSDELVRHAGATPARVARAIDDLGARVITLDDGDRRLHALAA